MIEWEARIERYRQAFPKWPVTMTVMDGVYMYGLWVMGNDYRVSSGYYGGYPATYLKRVYALFGDKKNTLHLFSGKVDTTVFPGKTVDLDPATEPDYLDDAQTLNGVPLERVDLVLCDPPYSVEDAEHYMPTMVKRNKVFAALKRLPPGAVVVWLDQVSPMYSKEWFKVAGHIGMVKSTNHRFRVVTFYERTDKVYDEFGGL